MCQLFALCANQPVNAHLSITEFRHRGERNPHGWGFAFSRAAAANPSFAEPVTRDDDWRIVKAPRSLARARSEELPLEVQAPIILGHVRLSSCGSQTPHNTHPFTRGRWAFAHNGTVNRIIGHPDFPLKSHRPEGQTDSEYAFLVLLEKIENAARPEVPALLAEWAARIAGFGRFNFLLSDGETLYAHGHDRLFRCSRRPPHGPVTLCDDGLTASLAEIKGPDERAILVATEPLTRDETWRSIRGIEVFSAGRRIRPAEAA